MSVCGWLAGGDYFVIGPATVSPVFVVHTASANHIVPFSKCKRLGRLSRAWHFVNLQSHATLPIIVSQLRYHAFLVNFRETV